MKLAGFKHRIAIRITTTERVTHEAVIAWLDKQLPSFAEIENTEVGKIDSGKNDARIQELNIE